MAKDKDKEITVDTPVEDNPTGIISDEFLSESYDFVAYDNEHIVPAPIGKLSDWFKHAHSLDEVKSKLREGMPDRYNDSSDDYHITDTENADFDKGILDSVTPYEKDKVKQLKEINYDS